MAGAPWLAARLGPAGQGLAQAARDAFLAGIRDGYLILGVVVVSTGAAIFAWATGRAR
ncbi:MAG TPA: hypothetical protein VJT49_33835 [Amycolatopsis sp.]|uniref:hypothetical protein n=1 Tax=Amycolatopsis sp. TaxID=37632 RepID=UPI002B471622|nr:hypothetical protein [Amycolatopsis sp.]HKS50004.1 hypothetical protein [Amycolatopsis sp.]